MVPAFNGNRDYDISEIIFHPYDAYYYILDIQGYVFAKILFENCSLQNVSISIVETFSRFRDA